MNRLLVLVIVLALHPYNMAISSRQRLRSLKDENPEHVLHEAGIKAAYPMFHLRQLPMAVFTRFPPPPRLLL